MTRQEVARLVAMAMANWPGLQDRNVKIEATAILWQKMLADVPYELAEKALCRVLINAKFWPTVAEIREAIEQLKPSEKSIPPADEAWEEVCRNLNPYRVPLWTHQAIGRTVKQLGGVRAICESEHMSVIRGQFFKIYEIYVTREKDEQVNQKVIQLTERTEMTCLG